MKEYLTVIIAFIDKDKKLLSDCILSHEESARSAGVKLRFILVANGANIPSIHLNSPVTVIKIPQNLGFAAAINKGLKKVSTNWCVIACPDTRCDKNSIKGLHPYISKKIAIVGPKVVEPDGKIQATIVPIPTLKSIFIEQTYLYKLLPWVFTSPLSDTGSYNYAHTTDAVAAIWWLANCKMLRTIGGFDERFFLYFEDVDLCKRLLDHGYHIYYEPKSCIRHLMHQSTGGGASGILYKVNMQKFLKKHYGEALSIIGIFFFFAGSLIRLIYWRLQTSARAKLEAKFYREILNL